MKLYKNILAAAFILFTYACQNTPSTATTDANGAAVIPKKPRYERPKTIPRKDALLNIPYRTIDNSKTLTTFGFGSCNDQNQAQPLWKLIKARSPQMFIMMGDNIYASKNQKQTFKDYMTDQYVKLNENVDYLNLREAVPFMATWDDHDYGQGDGGEDNPHKEEIRKIFTQYWSYLKNILPKTQDAIYHSRMIGSGKNRVQFILLDTRFNRSPLVKYTEPVIPPLPDLPTTPLLNSGDHTATLKADLSPTAAPVPVQPSKPTVVKMYSPNEDPKAHVLSEAQWKWLDEELKKPAELRIIISSIQFVANDHGFEKWGNFPLEKKRFLNVLEKNHVSNAVILSGDRHLASIAKMKLNKKTDLYDITSSALNKPSKAQEPEVDQTYTSPSYLGINFGYATIDWSKRQLDVQIIGEDDKAHLEQTIKF